MTPTSGFSKLDLTHGTKLTSGTLVGEYQIQGRIGEGGMGTVYSAIHPIIGKKVAIKVLAGRLAKNKNAIRRFVLEARAVNDIRHPGLVDIFSFGQLTDGRHYYVMEFLEGRDLGDVLRERICLPMAEAIPIFLEVGHALVAVHSKGIVHRDLKPENILLLDKPQAGGQRVKLVDFGLAKLVEGVPAHMREGAPSTAAGVNVGTPHYMSPEQCRGLKVDARADLYALGYPALRDPDRQAAVRRSHAGRHLAGARGEAAAAAHRGRTAGSHQRGGQRHHPAPARQAARESLPDRGRGLARCSRI